MTHILAIDQGTTSSRAILFDERMQVTAIAQQEFPQHFPRSGWVEHDPADLWSSTQSVIRAVLAKAGLAATDIAAIGITNQRETTLLWDIETGEPLHNAIVWQDRRTADTCAALRAAGHEPMIRARTGLLLDPYFSGTKLAWLLDHVEGARARAEAGKLAFGTVDSYLIWKLTEGRAHLTDATNAARTLLYSIRDCRWDPEICALLNIPLSLLPEVRDCAADFGTTTLFGAAIPILGVAGDQQAATIGQACFAPGMVKSTYGTGCFALANTGDQMVLSQNRLLTTIAYQLDGTPTYALEGWDAHARGAIYGLTRATGPAEIARAALESVGFQTRDLIEAIRADSAAAGLALTPQTLRVDGGMTASDWTMQFLADILGAPVDRPKLRETTALGAAWLAGHRAGLYPDAAGFSANWALDHRFTPKMPREQADSRYALWQDAVRRTLTPA